MSSPSAPTIDLNQAVDLDLGVPCAVVECDTEANWFATLGALCTTATVDVLLCDRCVALAHQTMLTCNDGHPIYLIFSRPI